VCQVSHLLAHPHKYLHPVLTYTGSRTLTQCTLLEGPVAGLLVVRVRLSAGWVDVDAAEMPRYAANFIRLETRLEGGYWSRCRGSCPCWKS
jgi:hypothetical protein